MSVKLELYRVFKEVAEVGNITAAAQALYISQSAVSQSIKQLEHDLQTRLFARNSRGVTLTAEGQMLYEYVRSAMGLLETGEEKLSQTRELQMGKLIIGASDTVTSQFLLPYLDSFHKQHPAIHIQIVSGRSHKVLGLLRSGKVDIAFASTPTDTSSLDIHPCFSTHAIFVAGAEYPCDFDHVYSLEEIAACMGYLRNQVALIRPKIIVCVGRIAAMTLIQPDYKVTRQHGEWIQKNGVWMMGTFHPAALLRNPYNTKNGFADFLSLREKIQELGIKI